MDSLTGQLLVALPVLDEPTFARAVVLVLDHDDEGALGVVLNRASQVPVHESLDAWSPLAAEPAVVFGGGPVEPTAVVGLGRRPPGAPAEPVGAALDTVQLVDLSDGADPGELETVRVFAGYAGWAPGQLEAELAQDAWLAVPARPEDVFTPDPDGLWSRVLARQPGRVRLLATFPPEPSHN